METIMMNTFQNLTALFAVWTAFMAVVLLTFTPTRERAHHIVDGIYDMGNKVLTSLGRAFVESAVLAGCAVVIADAVMATAIEGVIDKAGEAKAWVVEKAEARAAAKAAAKAKAEAEALADFARRARAAGFVHKDEVRELIRHINEQHSQLVSWECDYNSLQGAFAGAEEQIIELNEIIDDLVRKKYPHGVQVRVEQVAVEAVVEAGKFIRLTPERVETLSLEECRELLGPQSSNWNTPTCHARLRAQL